MPVCIKHVNDILSHEQGNHGNMGSQGSGRCPEKHVLSLIRGDLMVAQWLPNGHCRPSHHLHVPGIRKGKARQERGNTWISKERCSPNAPEAPALISMAEIMSYL